MLTLTLTLTNEIAEAFNAQLQLQHDVTVETLAGPATLQPATESELTLALVAMRDLLQQCRAHKIRCRILNEEEIRERGRKLAQFKRASRPKEG